MEAGLDSRFPCFQVSVLFPNLWSWVPSPTLSCLVSISVVLCAILTTVHKRAEEPLHNQHLMQRGVNKLGPERDTWLLQEAVKWTVPSRSKSFPADQSKGRIYSSWFCSSMTWWPGWRVFHTLFWLLQIPFWERAKQHGWACPTAPCVKTCSLSASFLSYLILSQLCRPSTSSVWACLTPLWTRSGHSAGRTLRGFVCWFV